MPTFSDLSVLESVSNATPNVGGEIIFTVTVSDLGPDSATNVQVSDLLPAGLTFVFATASQGTYTSASGIWTVGTVSTSAPQTLSIGALVASPGTQTNTAAIFHADQIDPNPANNSASVTETPQQADLSLSESVSNATPNVGGEITFTVTLSDLGPNSATNVQVSDLLPAGLTFVSASPSQGAYTSASGMWTVGTVSTSAPQTLSITALVARTGTRTNTAAITHADQFDPNPASNSTSATETAAPPAGTTADMILRHGANGLYEIYDIGNNGILAAQPLGQVGTDWQFVGLGRFFGNDTTDMLLRSASTGGFEVYDISNDQITGAAFLGAVGLNWQFSGVGNFSGLGESDMMLRNSNTGGLEVYDINNNQITGAAFIGSVGLNWQFSGVGNFSSVPGETDLILRNSTTGGLEVYDINNNQLTGAAFLGMVGLDWQFAGIAAANGAGTSDLVLRNVNTGAFEVYDIANNQLMGAAALGAVGTDWQLGLNLSTRASDGGLWGWQQCGGQRECATFRGGHVPAAAADDTATRMSAARR